MEAIRNVAIIAHVDHGKTTLVDKILHHCELFRENQETGDLILDNNDQERERGITIFSKNVSVNYKGTKINIIDTPGHADFGGEVERVLNMADGVLLLVDAFEGPMPQTRYVLSKSLELGLKPIVVINKVDKPNCRPEEVHEMVFDLMFNLDATEEQLDFSSVYGSAKDEWMSNDPDVKTDNIEPLLDMILDKVPIPVFPEGTLQMQITTIDYSSYVGRIAIGRVSRGIIKENMPVSLVKRDGSIIKSRTKELFTFDGLARKKVEEVQTGDLCALTGIPEFEIGDTIADFEEPEGMKAMSIDEPTMSMMFTINNSPFFGKEGEFVTSRHLRDRLMKEMEKNLALKVEDTASPDQLMVYGRGIMHLSVLIETMRREGYELQVGQPQVIIKEIDGKKSEPIELLTIDVPDTASGKVIELVNQRKGEMVIMEPKGDLVHLEFNIPSRGIIGLRTSILNVSAGEAIMAHRFTGYEPWKGDIPTRKNGTLIALETGIAIPFALDKLQDRGKFYVAPGTEIYEGQILGEHIRANDLTINITKTKKLTNMRTQSTDDKVRLAPPIIFSLEEALEYIQKDEYCEFTPKSIRMRKIKLKENERRKNN
ncbi:translational GTPase TypA [Salibacteraceae bacterium]|jgi:GTP-binding protein|nr:translational GTPase TypA [Crocinitomicaceae bacterium]MDA7730476.1 translational GTPase TypA [Salibacteraceae bacterium]MDB9725592.1 translational GTPase TypA [Salibacteraceae bacterium]MDC1204333.1 translational GTPase TypA [Salibacteraceae bacterium]|tara:strand:+ start:14174 stop:15967 length:1794 start_codon:yes stop_codon:yes gene_type:complete